MVLEREPRPDLPGERVSGRAALSRCDLQRHGDERRAAQGAGAHRDPRMDRRARKTGFTEWHSDVYYQKDITPLLSLVEWADDEELATRAAMLLDIVYLDMALHLHGGNFGATHGRSYIKDKASASTQDAFHSAKLLFDDTELPYNSITAPGRHAALPSAEVPAAQGDRTGCQLRRADDRSRADEPPARRGARPRSLRRASARAPRSRLHGRSQSSPLVGDGRAQRLWSILPITLEVGERENLWAAQFSSFKRCCGISSGSKAISRRRSARPGPSSWGSGPPSTNRCSRKSIPTPTEPRSTCSPPPRTIGRVCAAPRPTSPRRPSVSVPSCSRSTPAFCPSPRAVRFRRTGTGRNRTSRAPATGRATAPSRALRSTRTCPSSSMRPSTRR